MALPYKLSLQLEARLGLEVGPRVAKRSGERRESEGKRHLSVLPPLSLIDDPSDEPFLSNPLGPQRPGRVPKVQRGYLGNQRACSGKTEPGVASVWGGGESGIKWLTTMILFLPNHFPLSLYKLYM